MKYQQSEITMMEDSVIIPSDVYTVRITDVTATTSKKGNPMLVTEGVIADPPSVEVRNGNSIITVPILGRRIDRWYHLLDPTVPYGLGALISALKRADLLNCVSDETCAFNDELVHELIGKELRMHVLCEARYLEKEGPDGTRVRILDDNGNPIKIGSRLTTDWGRTVGKAGPSSNSTMAF